MTETPPVPDEFDSEGELKAYIDQLHDRIEFLEEEAQESEKEKLELKQELNELEDQVSRSGPGSFTSILEPLESMRQRIEELEQGKIDDLDGGPSEEAMENFYDAAGYHPDDN
jgi:predicted RNase H-like nuclease (RuvC/YqgF family)